MYCPICRSQLILGKGTKSYFSGEEWAENPEVIPSEHDYYICSNPVCDSHSYVFWDFFGNYYFHGDSASTLEKTYRSLHPFSSFCRRFQHGYENTDKKITVCNLFVYKLVLEAEYHDDDTGSKIVKKRDLCLYRRGLHGNYSKIDAIWGYLARNISQFKFETFMLKEHPDYFTVKHFFSYYSMKDCRSFNSLIFSSWIVLRYSNLKKSVISGRFFDN